MRYRVVLYPMLHQTLAVVSTTYDNDESERVYTNTYTLKTHGEGPWPLSELLRELSDQLFS
jgi:hypothetical protein